MSGKTAKQKRREAKVNGQLPSKQITMSREMKIKFDLRERVFREWTLIHNIMKSALQGEFKDKELKARANDMKELSSVVMAGVSQDLDYWIDTELAKHGFGKDSGYLLVGVDPDAGVMTLVKSPKPPMEGEGGLEATLNEMQTTDLTCKTCGKPAAVVHKDKGAFCEEHCPPDLAHALVSKGEKYAEGIQKKQATQDEDNKN